MDNPNNKLIQSGTKIYWPSYLHEIQYLHT